jgi:subtilase family serine protease
MVAAVPATWRRAGRVEEDKMMTLTFAMKQSNMDRIYETVRHVSEPTSPHYGQYLSIDEVAELVRPTDAAVRSVVEWASDAGASSITKTRGGEFIEVELLASRAEKALGSTLTRFEHVRSGRVLERMPEYSLPESVLANVDLVLGLNDFFDTKEERKPKDSIGNAPYVSGHLYGGALQSSLGVGWGISRLSSTSFSHTVTLAQTRTRLSFSFTPSARMEARPRCIRARLKSRRTPSW